MNRKNLKIFIYSLILIGFISGCQLFEKEPTEPKVKTAKDYSADVVFAWNDFYMYSIVKTIGYRPPVSARALAYIGLTNYEAIIAGMPDYQSIKGRFPTLKIPEVEATKEYHWGEVINQATRTSIRLYIPLSVNRISDSIATIYEKQFTAQTDTATFNRSKRYGETVALAVYQFALEDGEQLRFRNNKPSDYVPPMGEDKWRSTPPDFLGALTPSWGKVRTFVIKESDKELKPHIPFSKDPNSEFYKQAKEVYDAVKNKTKESVWISEFWSDDLHTYTIDAGGRWTDILNNYAKEQKSNLETVIYANAKMGLALHDVCVSCWNSKYNYNLLRPVTYINNYIEKDWRPLLRDPTKPVGQQIGVTPQHPSYPSGHSCFGQAAAEVLISVYGDKINFTDRTHEGETYFDGRPRTFTSFTQMSEENAYSRIPLGVHYRMDCVEGLRLGKIVGQRVNAVAWKKTM
jgi:hypothetical protein